MENFATKKVVLFTSLALLGVFFIINEPIIFGLCKSISSYDTGTKYCTDSRVDFVSEDLLLLTFFLAVSFIVFTLSTYKMREEVFRAWWNFARWFAPIVVLVTLFINMQNSGGLGIGGAIGGSFDMLVIGTFYAIFIGVSLWKIASTYWNTRHSK